MRPNALTHAVDPAPGLSPLKRDRVGAVTRLTLADPARRNDLSRTMLLELRAALAEAAADPDCRTILLAAEGKVFCAGHDLKELTARRTDADRGRAFYEEVFDLCGDVMQAIVTSPKPVIAAVEGMATAAGCQLVASADLAIAGDHAQFCTPGVDIGLFCSTPMVALSRAVSRHHALEMLLTGDAIPAAEAFRFGLVNRVVPAGDAASAALSWATRIATKSPLALATGKAAFAAQLHMPLAEAYAKMGRVMTDNLLAADAEEGIGAFLGKRAPQWPAS